MSKAYIFIWFQTTNFAVFNVCLTRMTTFFRTSFPLLHLYIYRFWLNLLLMWKQRIFKHHLMPDSIRSLEKPLRLFSTLKKEFLFSWMQNKIISFNEITNKFDLKINFFSMQKNFSQFFCYKIYFSILKIYYITLFCTSNRNLYIFDRVN